MTNALRLYFRLISSSARGQVHYRASTWLLVCCGFVLTCVEFFALWALFDHFGALRHWTLPQVMLCFGLSGVAFSLAGMLARGFDTFGAMVQSGAFDRILLRPRTTVLQLFGHDLMVVRLGRLTLSLLVLGWATTALRTVWTAPRVLLLIASISAGSCVYIGLYILQATMCFWTVQTLELMSSVIDGGNFAARVPMTIYRPLFRHFFTFVVPLACVNYLPLSVLSNTPLDLPPWLPWLTPLAGWLFLGICLLLWRRGVRHYCSVGS